MRELAHYPQSVTGRVSQYSEDVWQAETTIPLFAEWEHLHSSEMLLAMGPIAAHLLEERERLARIVRASFSCFSKNQMMLFAARHLLTPKKLGLQGAKTVTSAVIETAGEKRIHILGLESPNPVRTHVEKNRIADALTSYIREWKVETGTIVFPLERLHLGTPFGDTPFAGVALAHEVLMKSWQHLPVDLLPNGGFASRVDYSHIPSKAETATANALHLYSYNWPGQSVKGEAFSIVDIEFEFSRDCHVICKGTYKHLHPNTPEDKELMLHKAGITSSS